MSYEYIRNKDFNDILNLTRNLNSFVDLNLLLGLVSMVSSDVLVYGDITNPRFKELKDIVIEALQDFFQDRWDGKVYLRDNNIILALTYLESWGPEEEWKPRWNLLVDSHWGILSSKVRYRQLLPDLLKQLADRDLPLKIPFSYITLDYTWANITFGNDYDHITPEDSLENILFRLKHDVLFFDEFFEGKHSPNPGLILEKTVKGVFAHYKNIQTHELDSIYLALT